MICSRNTGKSKPVRGKYNTGEVLKVMGDRVIVKGINIVTKHNRPSQANPDGGITHEKPYSYFQCCLFRSCHKNQQE